jgi:hypothetical protein
MKREARRLLSKGLHSLTVSIDHFNSSSDVGRIDAVLISLDHSLEMLLKASILERGGEIREKPDDKETIGFDACVRKALSDGAIRFIDEDQALSLQSINGLRDAAQHHLLDISEHQLYLHCRAGVTLFADVMRGVFKKELSAYLPARALPLSTVAPVDIDVLFQNEVQEIAQLLKPGRRRRVEAEARLRPLAILDATVRGEKLQPSSKELDALGARLAGGEKWHDVFPGAASIAFAEDGAGPKLNLRLTKKEGIPVQLVPAGTPGASVVGVKRVDELGFYNLSHRDLAAHVDLTPPKTTAAAQYLNLYDDPECFKEIVIGKSRFKRYSQVAIERINKLLKERSIVEVWSSRRR